MKTIEYKTVDKSAWARGPWRDEPDKKQWLDPDTKLPCLIVRGPAGALCGYVGVLPGHPFYGVEYSQCPINECGDSYCHHSPEANVSVHGGLTFSDGCADGPEAKSICHLPEDGEPDSVWWLGFDCAHAGDLLPKPGMLMLGGEEYRDLAYVERQCRDLAKQLKEIAA